MSNCEDSPDKIRKSARSRCLLWNTTLTNSCRLSITTTGRGVRPGRDAASQSMTFVCECPARRTSRRRSRRTASGRRSTRALSSLLAPASTPRRQVGIDVYNLFNRCVSSVGQKWIDVCICFCRLSSVNLPWSVNLVWRILRTDILEPPRETWSLECRTEHCFGHSINKIFVECHTKNTRQN